MGEARRRRTGSDCCENCTFWEKHHRGNAGDCHAMPPSVVPIGMQAPALEGQLPTAICQGIWPPTAASRWCGAHQRTGNGAVMEIDLNTFAPIGGQQ